MSGPSELVLRPGLLETARARYARAAELRASPGTLSVTHGRRIRSLDVSGARLRPARSGAEESTRHLVALEHHGRGVLASLDLADWLPVQIADQSHPRQVSAWLDEASQTLAAALGVPWQSSGRSKGPSGAQLEAGPRLVPEDSLLRRGYVAVLLACAVLVAAGLVLGLSFSQPSLLVAAGVAAVPLALLGFAPSRWWIGASGGASGGTTGGASGGASGDWQQVRTRSRAGWVRLDGGPVGVDTAETGGGDGNLLTLQRKGVPLVAVSGAEASRLEGRLGDRVRRSEAARPRETPDLADTVTAPEESTFGALVFGALLLVAAGVVRSTSVAAAAAFVVAAACSLAMALTLVTLRARGHRP